MLEKGLELKPRQYVSVCKEIRNVSQGQHIDLPSSCWTGAFMDLTEKAKMVLNYYLHQQQSHPENHHCNHSNNTWTSKQGKKVYQHITFSVLVLLCMQ